MNCQRPNWMNFSATMVRAVETDQTGCNGLPLMTDAAQNIASKTVVTPVDHEMNSIPSSCLEVIDSLVGIEFQLHLTLACDKSSVVWYGHFQVVVVVGGYVRFVTPSNTACVCPGKPVRVALKD